MRTALVTGASGFVGRHLCAELLERGYTVRGLVRRSDAHLPSGAAACPITGIDDAPGIAAAAEGVDVVFHLAARVHVMRDTAGDPLSAFRRVNVEGTRNLLDRAAELGVRKVVYISSVSALGTRAGEHLIADTPPRPNTPYGISKREAEELIVSRAAAGGPDAVILRPPGVYGPGMKGNIPRLFRLVDRGLPVPAPSCNRRSLIFVGNLVDAAISAAEASWRGARTFLVADDEPLSTAALVREIARALDRPARIVPIPEGPVRLLAKLGDVVDRRVPFPLTSVAVDRLFGSLTVDSTEAREALGYRPRFSVSEGLGITADWYRSSVAV